MRAYDLFANRLELLSQAPEQDLDNGFIQSGIIAIAFQQFDFGWKLFKALLAYEGDITANTGSPRDVIKAAYQYYDFMDEDVWLSMLRDRNTMAHAYDANVAKRLVNDVIERYIPEFARVQQGLEARYGELLRS